jgi:aminoglycoside 3-N-acetyltransferase
VITSADITGALRRLGVRPHDVLFVHSDVRRLLRAEGRTRDEKLATVARGLEDAVPEGTLILPTFSWSFCGGEPFDRDASPSAVGVLTEFFRRRPGVRRTADPLFSCAVRGPLPPPWERRLMQPGDTDAFGPESVFAYLVQANARIALLGVDATRATLIHHVEQLERVPYRYTKAFHGIVKDATSETPATARYYVRDLDAGAENDLVPLVGELRTAGVLAETELERGPQIGLVCAQDLVAVTGELVRQDPEFLLERPLLRRTG